MIKRLIPKEPIKSKYSGICSICKKNIEVDQYISPFFEGEKNLWRHSKCIQLFFLPKLKFSSKCIECGIEMYNGEPSYWSKHNGIWCIECGEELIPTVLVSYSREQDLNITIKKLLA